MWLKTNSDMSILFRIASFHDAKSIGSLVLKLTEEICTRTKAQHFDVDLASTIQRCENLMRDGHYGAILGFSGDSAIAVATFTESYALYAGGKIGIIPEFYVEPDMRSSGVGAKLIDAVKRHGRTNGWSCIELCTPPLPEFERTLQFYQDNGLIPVGGRKMRIQLG